MVKKNSQDLTEKDVFIPSLGQKSAETKRKKDS